MFKHIYLFELRSWFSRPAIYIYLFIIFAISTAMMASAVGVFDSNTATVTSLKLVNSPNSLLGLTMAIAILVFLLFPNVAGASIYKDYKHRVHHVMYSYPFDKSSYFFGKYFSAFTICLILTLVIALGLFFGMSIPGANQDLIGPHSITPYLHTYAIYVIPGVFLFSAIVFAIVTFGRNIVAGFVVMIVLYILQGVLETSLSDLDYQKISALADPFGSVASSYYTKYWTISEENTAMIPFKGLVIWNRVIWMIVGAVILWLSYHNFEFHTEPKSWSWQFWKKKKEVKSASHKSGQQQVIALPQVNRSFGPLQVLSSAWNLTKIDLRYILKGGPFIVISILGLLMLILMLAFGAQILQTSTWPSTSRVLGIPGAVFRLFITLLTMVYTGLLINRRTADNIFQLEDTTPTRNLSFILSKFMSITLMQGVLLILPMVAGIIYQITQGYYDFEIGLYLYDLFIVRWLQFVPWTLMALFIFTIIPNFYIGLVVILVLGMGMSFLDMIGIEQSIFKFNDGPNASYSDIDSYGWFISRYYIYRFYWFLGGLIFAIIGWTIWRRGMSEGGLKAFRNIPQRFFKPNYIALALGLIAFLGMGRYIYYHTNIKKEYLSSKEREERTAEYEKLYKSYSSITQPRIVDIDVKVDLYPETGDFYAEGSYLIKNKSDQYIDTVVIDHVPYITDLDIDMRSELVLHDTIYNFRVYELLEPMAPGEVGELTFEIKNKENTPFRREITVRENGTFLNSSLFPNLGYQSGGELSDNKVRKKYDLPDRERMPDITDTSAYANTYLSNCADWVDFKIQISTAPDQIAIAPGTLQKEWEDKGRRYFSYEMQRPMLNFYNISSARYEVLKDQWNEVELAIYYHKGHEYNLDRMMRGLKDGLDYFTENFSPYQHGQVRILEFPRASFAQSFANTIPFSENIGFMAQVDDEDQGGVDFAYSITAHELAHQWWAHQVIGANVKGATMLSESLSEYSSLKVLEKRYGPEKKRIFLKDALDKYLLNRSLETTKELPLALNENQPYIHYQKGSVVFYGLSDLIGEKNLNQILSSYIDSVAFQEAPYTNALELVGMIKSAVADSFHYYIDDNFTAITLYDNRIESTSYVLNPDSTYTVDITAHVRKYRTNERGRQVYKNEVGEMDSLIVEGRRRPMKSYPLRDYVDVGIFGTETVDGKDKEKILYLQKHRIEEIENKFTITVDELPKEVGIDPYNILIDRNSEDNRRVVKEKEK